MTADHSFAIKILSRQIKNYEIELKRIIPLRESLAIKEMELRISKLKTTALVLSNSDPSDFITDKMVMEYLDDYFKDKMEELMILIKDDDQKIDVIIKICLDNKSYGRIIRFINPEYFNKIRIMLIEQL